MRRPVFHSEADFQYEFARELQSLSEDFEIRLERPVRLGETGTFNVDVLVRWMGSWHGIELKYITAELTAELDGESFILKAQAAQDLRRYDIVKDVHRLERLAEHGAIESGVSVTLTNDRSLWSKTIHADPVDAAFRLHEGRTIEGELAWHERAGAGTRRGREQPLALSGSFALQWGDFSLLTGLRNGLFRQLVILVGATSDRA